MGNKATIATVFEPLLRATLGPRPALGFEFWDGSTIRPHRESSGTMRVRSEDALRHLVWAPGELGLARAFVSGTVDLDGDIFTMLRALQSTATNDTRLGLGAAWQAIAAARQLGALGRRPQRPRRRRDRSAGRCTPNVATRRRSVITTTSATTSTGWCSDRA